MKTIDEIILEICEEMNISHIFARLRKDSILMDSITKYPAMVRGFNESIILGKFDNIRGRRCLFYFCDLVGSEPDAMTMLSPTCSRMETLAVQFLKKLNAAGVRTEVANMQNDVSRFDTLEAGVSVNVTLTYNICP